MDDDASKPRRRRPLLTALVVVAAVAAVPAGVALAGGSEQPSGAEGQAGPDATGVQSTAPDRDRDREDCPKGRHGGQGSGEQGSGSPGLTTPDSGQSSTSEL